MDRNAKTLEAQSLETASRLREGVLDPMKQCFTGKDEIIDLLGLCLAGGENLFVLGPPGTAKSALVRELGLRIHGRTFEYLLTRFTEPNELFGPFDIRKLREGILETNTEGMLPEASIVFLDELLNANSAILNSILTILNERVLRRGREVLELPLLTVVGASNHLPEEEALQALFDRFLLRVRSDNVPDERLAEVLASGWELAANEQVERSSPVTAEEVRVLQQALPKVDLTPALEPFVAMVRRLRTAGIPISDRRAVKLQRLVAASALLCGRSEARTSDLWVLRYIWDTEEQQELLKSVVDEVIKEPANEPGSHPRARHQSLPDPDLLANEIDAVTSSLEKTEADDPQRALAPRPACASRGTLPMGWKRRAKGIRKRQTGSSMDPGRRPRRGSMSRPIWAVELDVSDKAAAQALRLVTGVEARYSSDDSTLWLRGSEMDERTSRLVRQLPCRRRFELLENGQGVPVGKTVPVVTLSGSGWVPLRHLTTLKPPAPRRPGSLTNQVGLELVAAEQERPPNLLCLSFQTWHDYAVAASAIRLAPLRFAVAEDGRTVVHGSPLPPLLGDFFTLEFGVALPSGYTLRPRVEPPLLARHFHLQDGDVLLFHPNNTCECLGAEGFAQASRSAVRETVGAVSAINE